MANAEDRNQLTDGALEDGAGPPTCPALPLVDDDTLDTFLREPAKVERLPVEPAGYRREFQRMIVSAFLHHGSEPSQAA
jgi:hypothetical protein